MDAESLLAQAPQYFENKGEINLYKPRKITDLNGFQYLVKGAPTVIKGAIHTERFLEENPFGNFGGASIILSTHKESEIVCGDLIEANGEFYAIAHQKPINDKTNEYDFVCYSIYDYYKDFLIDDEAQANQILGNNSMRYILSIQTQNNIPILPSFFALVNAPQKYIKVNINSSQANSIVRRNAGSGALEQWKKDFVTFYAVGLDTNDLLDFADTLSKQSELGVTRYPTWIADNRYNKEFDIKANIQRMDIEFNYVIIGTQAQVLPPIIREAFCNYLS